MPFRSENYDFFVFDCDGVLLDSNSAKSDAFFEVTLPFGRDQADRFVAYHKMHGGISRQEKFKYFVREILEVSAADRASLESELVESYGERCRAALRTCSTIPGVEPFLKNLPKAHRGYVVSGGAQTEVRSELAARHIDVFFSRILGNPKSKEENMRHLAETDCFEGRGAYFGDARLDMELAQQFGLDFVFVSAASEWKQADEDFHGETIEDFRDLLERG